MNSLALYASPIEDIEPCATKNNNHNKTIKKRQNNMTPHVKALVERIHKQQDDNNSGSCSLGDFKPIQPPVSMGVERKIMRDNTDNDNDNDNDNYNNTNQNNKQPDNVNEISSDENGDDAALSMEGFSNLDDTYAHNYYDNMPTYNKILNQNQTQGNEQGTFSNSNSLIDKLNYMIHLLEEQKNEKTGSVTEELILYSFLGIFIIFIVDSFARVGKYVR